MVSRDQLTTQVQDVKDYSIGTSPLVCPVLGTAETNSATSVSSWAVHNSHTFGDPSDPSPVLHFASDGDITAIAVSQSSAQPHIQHLCDISEQQAQSRMSHTHHTLVGNHQRQQGHPNGAAGSGSHHSQSHHHMSHSLQAATSHNGQASQSIHIKQDIFEEDQAHGQVTDHSQLQHAESHLDLRSDHEHEQDYSSTAVAAVTKQKSSRLPGTKVCPKCENIIAAALARCKKCQHTFREKKEKVKRSGKRGKKTCPKCSFENPSACSTCKSCGHVFRLKLGEKYRAIRDQRTGDASSSHAATAVAAAMAAVGESLGNTSPSQHVAAAAAIGFLPHSPDVSGHPMAQSASHHHAIGNVMHAHHQNVQLTSMSSHHAGMTLHRSLDGLGMENNILMTHQRLPHHSQHSTSQLQSHHHQQLANCSAPNAGDDSL